MKKKIMLKKLKLNQATRLVAVSFGVVAVLFVAFLSTHFAYANKILPEVSAGGVNVGGLTRDQAKQVIAKKIASAKDNFKIVLVKDGQEYPLLNNQIALNYNLDQSVDHAFQIGRKHNFLFTGLYQIKLVFQHQKLGLVPQYNSDALNVFLASVAQKYDQPYRDAGLEIRDGQVVYTMSSTGKVTEVDFIKNSIIDALGQVQSKNIAIPVVTSQPKIEKADTEQAKIDAEQMISSSFTLAYDDQKASINPSQIGSWISFVEQKQDPNQAKNNETGNTAISPEDLMSQITAEKYQLVAVLDQQKMATFVDELAKKIDIPAQDAKFGINNNQVVMVQKEQNGRSIDRTKLADDMRKVIANPSSDRLVQVPIKDDVPEISEANFASLGLKELIAKGQSNFAGSPTNRVFNIGIGTRKYEGILIKPGEDFSFNTVLGPVDASAGYLQELVIKLGQGVVPDYGGGLCQVSTTMFRAAIYAGLPILERQEHAFVVSYYNPPGFDATIFEPHPDLRFTNDTGHYILVHTYIAGSNLTFEFWGTKDGRQVTVDGPVQYDKQASGAMKARLGVKVTNADGSIRWQRDFLSNYGNPADFHPKSTPTPTSQADNPAPTPTPPPPEPTPTP